jgi:hypothetical protein
MVTPEDIILIKTDFVAFDTSLIKTETQIPAARQVLEGTATKSIESATKGTQTAAVSATLGSAFFRVMLKGSLS